MNWIRKCSYNDENRRIQRFHVPVPEDSVIPEFPMLPVRKIISKSGTPTGRVMPRCDVTDSWWQSAVSDDFGRLCAVTGYYHHGCDTHDDIYPHLFLCDVEWKCDGQPSKPRSPDQHHHENRRALHPTVSWACNLCNFIATLSTK